MIVISDTSPLNYLVLIGQAEIVHELYDRVIIPQAVYTAAERGLIELPAAIHLLQQTTFRASPRLYEVLLEQNKENIAPNPQTTKPSDE